MLSPEVNKPVFKKFKCFIDFLPILIRIFRRPIEVIRIQAQVFKVVPPPLGYQLLRFKSLKSAKDSSRTSFLGFSVPSIPTIGYGGIVDHPGFEPDPCAFVLAVSIFLRLTKSFIPRMSHRTHCL